MSVGAVRRVTVTMSTNQDGGPAVPELQVATAAQTHQHSTDFTPHFLITETPHNTFTSQMVEIINTFCQTQP